MGLDRTQKFSAISTSVLQITQATIVSSSLKNLLHICNIFVP
jgi:hypothetical protein